MQIGFAKRMITFRFLKLSFVSSQICEKPGTALKKVFYLQLKGSESTGIPGQYQFLLKGDVNNDERKRVIRV